MKPVVSEHRPLADTDAPLAVLIGPMGAGKTTVGTELAAELEVPFIDADEFIERITRFSIPELFESFGEDHFREVEASSVAHLLETFPGVLALGGGALTTPRVRELLATAPTILLRVDPAHVAERLGDGSGRPMLGSGAPMRSWRAVTESRRAWFEHAASWSVDTNDSTPTQIARALAERLRAGTAPSAAPRTAGLDRPVKVPTGRSARGVFERVPVGSAETGSGYDVVIGRGLDDEVLAAVPESSAKVLIVHQPTVRASAERLQHRLDSSGRTALIAEIPDAEEGKTSRVMEFLWQILGQSDLSRADTIIGLGGGACTDLAGFAAATWLRGVTLIQVPTTVAGMVDAAVGGKTGINTAEGKNLVGSFYPPRAVIEDLDVLTSLPVFDVAAGLAEAVKTGLIADTRILDIVEADALVAQDVASPEFAELVIRSVRVKARVVSGDLKETGEREFLNYGHTLGHAIEHNERYQWRHGAAVGVGMMFAAHLAQLAGKLSEADVDRHHDLLTSLGLPTTYRSAQWPRLLEAMKRDKKTRAGILRFIVLDSIGHPTRLEGPDPALLLAAYAAITDDDATPAPLSLGSPRP